jgi:cation diffusion facilitator CzcD-associated flavoprotein CzcO
MLDAANCETVTDVLIVGAGFGGLAMGVKLRAAGFEDFLIIEKGDDVGGTWRDNTYPGCACDVPSHLYSLSFAQKPDWSRMYPGQAELFEYVKTVADEHDLRRRIRFGTAMLAAAWDMAAGAWVVTTDRGIVMSRVLISAMGGLHIPALPELPGLERFAGPKFHSARWDHSVDLAGKRVAVVGTGASAIQFVPRIAAKVARLDVYQRTPAWVIPKPDRAFAPWEKAMLRLRTVRAAFRRWLFELHELRVLSFLGNKRALAMGTKLAREHLAKSVKDPVLRAKLTPDFQIGCKRVMLSNDYYPALQRENVELITDRIAEVRKGSIVDKAGAERFVDAIVFGTGFEVTTSYRHMRLVGVGGVELAALWDRTGMAAYLGIAVSGFPNYFMLMGPHTGLGHNSVVIMIEAQVGYVVDALTKMRAAGIGAIDVEARAQRRFVESVETRLQGTVWQDGGCSSWYKDEHGKVTAVWPGSAAAYVKAVKAADLRDYRLLARQPATVA